MNGSLKGVNMDECFISVDIETTGPAPGIYSIYELGACVVGNEKLCFERNIQLLHKNSYCKDTLQAMGIGGVWELEGRVGIVSPAEAMAEFGDWVKGVTVSAKPVFVANNAPFDWMFVEWYFNKFKIKNPFGHSALDMKAYFMGQTNCPWKEATLKNMAIYTGIPFEKLPHRAVLDATIQAQIFKQLIHKRKEEA